MKAQFLSPNFFQTFKIKYPIIQAPMAGGISTPHLVASVNQAGGIGFLAAGYLSAATLEKQILEVKSKSNSIFGVNLFIVDSIKIDNCIKPENICEIEKELEIYKNDRLNIILDEENDKKIDVIIKNGVKIVSFTFGISPQEWIQKLKKHDIYTVGNCTNFSEAKALETSECDAIVVQGIEAGGHRSSFLNKIANDEIGLFALLQEIKRNIKIPLIAAGGIANGKSLLAAKILGATAVQIGTGFLLTNESGAADAYKNEILHGHAHDTVLTKDISGKKARGKMNSLITKLHSGADKILPFPVQNALTKEIRNFAASQNDPNFMSLWCGQSVNLCQKIVPVQNFIEAMMLEYQEEIRKHDK